MCIDRFICFSGCVSIVLRAFTVGKCLGEPQSLSRRCWASNLGPSSAYVVRLYTDWAIPACTHFWTNLRFVIVANVVENTVFRKMNPTSLRVHRRFGVNIPLPSSGRKVCYEKEWSRKTDGRCRETARNFYRTTRCHAQGYIILRFRTSSNFGREFHASEFPQCAHQITLQVDGVSLCDLRKFLALYVCDVVRCRRSFDTAACHYGLVLVTSVEETGLTNKSLLICFDDGSADERPTSHSHR
jgi:hypothetical protein